MNIAFGEDRFFWSPQPKSICWGIVNDTLIIIFEKKNVCIIIVHVNVLLRGQSEFKNQNLKVLLFKIDTP